MNDWKITAKQTGETNYFDSEEEANQQASTLPGDYTVEPVDEVAEANPSTSTSAEELEERTPEDVEVVDMTEDGKADTHTRATHPEDYEWDEPEGETKPDVSQTEPSDVPAELQEDPIKWLRDKNSDFVNVIKSTPAISKQGFRFIQQRYGITTESKVVETFEDPLGVVVWARAERPDGQFAEAHGEGYKTERDVDDNEFVRYADTRAKNRAISDLTSAGALAVSELGGTEESEP